MLAQESVEYMQKGRSRCSGLFVSAVILRGGGKREHKDKLTSGIRRESCSAHHVVQARLVMGLSRGFAIGSKTLVFPGLLSCLGLGVRLPSADRAAAHRVF